MFAYPILHSALAKTRFCSSKTGFWSSKTGFCFSKTVFCMYIYPPPCRRHSCVYNVHTGPCIQSSSFPVLQSPRFPDPVPVGVGVWSRSLETHSGESILRGVQGGSSRAVAWIPTPQEELPAPKFAYLASSWRSCAPSWLILALLSLILSPSCSKMAPSWPNIAQHRAKMSQHGLQEHPKTPKNLKNPQVFRCF